MHIFNKALQSYPLSISVMRKPRWREERWPSRRVTANQWQDWDQISTFASGWEIILKIPSISVAFYNFWSTFPFIISFDPHHNRLIHISINILNLLKREPRILEVMYALVRRKPKSPVPGLFGAVKSWRSEVLHCLPWFAVACQSELRSRFVFLVSQNFRRLEETPPPPTYT